jgi:hypothetical protein
MKLFYAFLEIILNFPSPPPPPPKLLVGCGGSPDQLRKVSQGFKFHDPLIQGDWPAHTPTAERSAPILAVIMFLSAPICKFDTLKNLKKITLRMIL